MKWIGLAWNLIPAAYRGLAVLGTVVTILAFLGGIYAWIDHQGYVRGAAARDAFWQREIHLIEQANQAAVNRANKELADNQVKLDTRTKELSNVLADIDQYYAQAPAEVEGADPSSGRRYCLGPDSVRRLNSIH